MYGALAALVAIPALLLLYFLKLRRKELPVSSTILWKKAVQDLQVNSPFQKLRRNLLLLLQMLILAALLLALANPITFYRPGAGANTVILIDRSASMNAIDVSGKSRLDEAKRRALDLVDSMKSGARMMVIAFDDSAETVQSFTSDVPALKRAVQNIQPTDRASQLKLAYQLADAQMNFDPQQLRSDNQQSVFLFSDGKVTDSAELSLRGTLTYEPIGDPASKNIAIVSFSAKRNYENPNQVQVFARLGNFGPEPVETDVQLSVSTIDPDHPEEPDHFTINQAKNGLRLFPARWTNEQRREAEEKQGLTQRDSVEFTLDLSTAAVIKIEQMSKTGDVLAADDTAMVVVPPPKPLKLLLVTDGNYFLEKAVRALPLQDIEVLYPSEYEQKRPEGIDVIVFDRHSPRYMPPSGNFVWFGKTPPNSHIKQSVDDKGLSLLITDAEALDWNRDHPILRHLQLNKLFVAEALKLDIPLSAQTLIDSTKGPLLVLNREGRYVHLVCAFDSLQSNWPLRKSFPLFINNAMQFMALGSDLSVRESFRPGATPRIPGASLQALLQKSRDITLHTPDGPQKLHIPDQGDFALPALQHVGLYRPDPMLPQFERLAVNLLDENESNIEPFQKTLGDKGNVVVVEGKSKTRLDLWWWLIACGAIPILMIEWWVFTRRVHA